MSFADEIRRETAINEDRSAVLKAKREKSLNCRAQYIIDDLLKPKIWAAAREGKHYLHIVPETWGRHFDDDVTRFANKWNGDDEIITIYSKIYDTPERPLDRPKNSSDLDYASFCYIHKEDQSDFVSILNSKLSKEGFSNYSCRFEHYLVRGGFLGLKKFADHYYLVVDISW